MKQQSMDAEPWALGQVACLRARIFACICKYEYTCQNRETNWKESIMKKTFAVLGNMQLGVSRFTKQFPAWIVLHWGVASWFLLPYVLQSSTEDSSEAFNWVSIVSSHHVLYCTCVHIYPYTNTPIINWGVLIPASLILYICSWFSWEQGTETVPNEKTI
jgi:hypothetical protein